MFGGRYPWTIFNLHPVTSIRVINIIYKQSSKSFQILTIQQIVCMTLIEVVGVVVIHIKIEAYHFEVL